MSGFGLHISKAAGPMQWIARELRNSLIPSPPPPPTFLYVVPAVLLLAGTIYSVIGLKKALKADKGFTFQ